ncbi:hypothetical protein JQ559_21995 [Bradyrhizobium viridifuturi]|jgi:hypothetical protein|uniref:hypothetical protein n=1 Tax=Bradyrhizobium TaxID=374 RepID=UPI000397ED13|nr:MULTISPECIES: hypothetical protein [Bradyrhizobium]ERF82091.1 MAG: hypothetical protein C207_04705 [Bradyrhizobium sp. DFCI-1]OYU59547.1 MAG: hypothetical protein CFE30_25400 [Bradyrhizobium sp. PARBB1]PSO23976.1 hypothetical protein C7G43_20970 [Bradyrhizobium sp. MOS004]QRI69518.1 hypothetical protein JQ507_32460 [Bradyrhizobium sp. PSBB068]MBR1022148.1 hypothetical protein [Bradyrhizobium viridifuturi]
MRESTLRCGLLRRLGVAAAAVLALSIASQQRAEALSVASPGTVPAAKSAADAMTTQVRHGGGGGHGGGGFHGGGFHGGGFHGGGFHGGGFRGFHGGGFRAAPAFHGGYRYGGFHRHYGGYHRFHGGGYRYGYRPYYRRHFHHRRYFYGSSYYPYYYPAYYHHHRCRVIWTYYGPRRICRPWWHHRHYWRPYRVYW